MNTYSDKTPENKNRLLADRATKKQNGGEPASQFADNRPEAIQMQKWQVMADNSPQTKTAAQLQDMAVNYSAHQHQPIQKKESTGLTVNPATEVKDQPDVIQAKMVGGYDVTFTQGYATWDQDGTRWHINWALGDKEYH